MCGFLFFILMFIGVYVIEEEEVLKYLVGWRYWLFLFLVILVFMSGVINRVVMILGMNIMYGFISMGVFLLWLI